MSKVSTAVGGGTVDVNDSDTFSVLVGAVVVSGCTVCLSIVLARALGVAGISTMLIGALLFLLGGVVGWIRIR